VFDFDYGTLLDIEDAVGIHDQVISERHLRDAKRHMAEAAYNARMADNLLGLEEYLLEECHDVLHGVGTIRIANHAFRNSSFQRLADEFGRVMNRADTAEEVGISDVSTEEY